MATFDFTTITAAQAQGYNSATDTLTVPLPLSLFDFTVGINDAAGTVTLTDTVTSQSVVFGSGLEGELIIGAGGVALQIGTAGPDNMAFASIQVGGAGADTISGGSVAYGGPGNDLFLASYASHIGEIRDWESGDSLYMSNTAPTAANYVEGSAADQNAASAFATSQIMAGKDYVVVSVGSNLFVYVDYLDAHTLNGAQSQTELIGRGLNDISIGNFVASSPNNPVITPPPPGSAGAEGFVFGDMDGIHLSALHGAPITMATATQLTIGGHDSVELVLSGIGLTYDANQQLTGGLVNSIIFQQPMPDGSFFQTTLTVHNISAAPFSTWVATDATQTALSTILSGNDVISGNDFAHPDVIHGYGGNDLIYGNGGADTLWGGDGDDTIYAQTPPNILGAGSPAATYLRGEAGNDTIIGGQAFDDINGNMGADSLHGGAGDDWVVGGKDDDIQFGDDGNDVVWGNLGNDTLDGGAGNDQVRGGQGDDIVNGGAGDDFVSGDRGNDTITGGAGADLFHGSQDAGIDRVLDFHLAEGDRVMLDPGTTYTLTQVGADTVIDMGASGGQPNQMILVGVQLSSLTPGWIFEG